MTSPPPEEQAPPAVAAARTIGGVVLAIVGIALGLFGAFWFFLVPWFGWATEGFWNVMAEWSDLGGAAVGIGGFILLVIGGALTQRARKRRFDLLVEVTPDAGSGEPPAGRVPPTVL